MAGEEDTTLLPEQPTVEPPDASVGVEDYGVTPAEESHREPLAQRLARELPERRRDRLEAQVEQRPAEEAAMHVRSDRALDGAGRGPSTSERLEFLETQVAALLAMARVHSEALDVLTSALQHVPTEEPGTAPVKIRRAARDAHDLLLSLRSVGAAE